METLKQVCFQGELGREGADRVRNNGWEPYQENLQGVAGWPRVGTVSRFLKLFTAAW